MRKREEEKKKKAEIEATRSVYRCSVCSHFCFKLGNFFFPRFFLQLCKMRRRIILNCSVLPCTIFQNKCANVNLPCFPS